MQSSAAALGSLPSLGFLEAQDLKMRLESAVHNYRQINVGVPGLGVITLEALSEQTEVFSGPRSKCCHNQSMSVHNGNCVCQLFNLHHESCFRNSSNAESYLWPTDGTADRSTGSRLSTLILVITSSVEPWWWNQELSQAALDWAWRRRAQWL
jgi:hypothetical protein